MPAGWREAALPFAAVLTLRDAMPEDAPALCVLATHVYVATYCELGAGDEEGASLAGHADGAGRASSTSGLQPEQAREALANYSVAEFERRLARGHRITLAQRGVGLLGFAETAMTGAAPLPSELSGALELLRLYVAPPAHGRGIGRVLLGAAEAEAAAHGCPALWLTAWAGNKNARAFYAHCGYADIGRTDYRFEDQVFENRVLVKRLPPARGRSLT